MNGHVNRLIPAMLSCQTPIVCTARGWVIGLGLDILLASDFAVVADDARLWAPFTTFGFTPDSGATWLIPRLVGVARAREMLMLGEKVSGADAASWNMVHRAVSPPTSMPSPRNWSTAWLPHLPSPLVSPSCCFTGVSPPTSPATWQMRPGRWKSPVAPTTSRSMGRRARRSASLVSPGDRPRAATSLARTNHAESDIIFTMEFAGAEAGAVRAAGRPLEGIRVLAIEQMQALPYATQLLGRLGADVVKVEPLTGELGRASLPAMSDPEGRSVGATFLRNNLNKRSMCVDLKSTEGRQLVLDLAPRFDIFAENFKAGAMDRMGLGYDDIVAVHPRCIYASVSGFGNSSPSPYRDWPAFAPIVEAMSGVYEMKRTGDLPPVVSPVGALGDIGAALYTSIGILAALRDRDRTGRPAYVDVAMLDSVIAMTDIVTNYWSMGVDSGDSGSVINHGFRASDGWFVMQVARVHVFERLAQLVGHPEWVTDERFDTPYGWVQHLEDVIRPAVEKWAAGRSRLEVCKGLSEAGIAAGPCARAEELVADAHVQPVTCSSALIGLTGWTNRCSCQATQHSSSTGTKVVTVGSLGSASTRTRSCEMNLV